jgi:hypothetical protein
VGSGAARTREANGWVAATTIMVASAAGMGGGEFGPLLPRPARRTRICSRAAAKPMCPEIARPVVFTLPAQIADIAYQNKTVLYDLLFKAPDDRLP